MITGTQIKALEDLAKLIEPILFSGDKQEIVKNANEVIGNLKNQLHKRNDKYEGAKIEHVFNPYLDGDTQNANDLNDIGEKMQKFGHALAESNAFRKRHKHDCRTVTRMITKVILVDGRVGYSWCSMYDQWDRKLGNDIAFSRAKKQEIPAAVETDAIPADAQQELACTAESTEKE